MSVRSRVRNILIAGATLLGGAGVFVVTTFPPSPSNLGLDCRYTADDAGVGSGTCTALLEPPSTQCAALLSTGGEPLFPEQDAGFPNSGVRVARVLNAFLSKGAAQSVHCEAEDDQDAGTGCWCEMEGSVSRDATGHVDGQAAAWHDVIDAQHLGSIFVDGRVSLRPARMLHGGCRAHVWAGEDPCAGSTAIQDGQDPP